jgi:Tol biopolymer transport system component
VRSLQTTLHAATVPGARRSWTAIAGGVLVAAALVAVAVVVGARVDGQSSALGPEDASSLDYVHPATPLPSLSAAYVRSVLGGDAVAAVAAGPSEERAETTRAAAAPPARRVRENDDLVDAFAIDALPFRARSDMGTATRERSEPGDCLPAGPTRWFRYAASANAALLASLIGDGAAGAVAVYVGDGRTLELLGCDVDRGGRPVVGFAAAPGKTYWFQATMAVGAGDALFALEPYGALSRASVGSSGEQGNGGVDYGISVSADGRYVAFVSAATNLAEDMDQTGCVADDPLAASDPRSTCGQVFVRDRVTGTTVLASVSSTGEMANSKTISPSLSADGRYVVFETPATNLAPGDRSFTWDLFVHDLATGTTERVPARTLQAPEVEMDVDGSFMATISADGRYVAFQSPSPDLVPGDDNGEWDVFVYDRIARRTELVSVSSSGAPSAPWRRPNDRPYWMAPSMSADGRYIVFRSRSSNLVPGDRNGCGDEFVRDRLRGTTERVSVAVDGGDPDGESSTPSGMVNRPRISDDGRSVVFLSAATNLVPGDTNGALDVFVRDRATGTTTRASVSSLDEQARVSPDQTDAIGRVASAASISPDGRFVVFDSFASNLAPGDDDAEQDVFLRDLRAGTTVLLTIGPDGSESSGGVPATSRAAEVVAFYSVDDSLVPHDTNGAADVFVVAERRR